MVGGRWIKDQQVDLVRLDEDGDPTGTVRPASPLIA
jgi:phenolic acid decarboxylase